MNKHIEAHLGFLGDKGEEILNQHYPIHKACRDGDVLKLLNLIPEATFDNLLVEDQFCSWMPIHWSAYFGKVECLTGLLQCGVDVNVQTSKFCVTPLHVAVFGGQLGIIGELLNWKVNINAKDYLGETSLHKAAEQGNKHCIQALLHRGALATCFNNNGKTALDIAREKKFCECMQLLEAAMAQGDHASMKLKAELPNGGCAGSFLSSCNFNTMPSASDVANRKRPHDELHISTIKRPRINGVNHSNTKNQMLLEDVSGNTNNLFSPYAKTSQGDTAQKSFLEETYHDVKAREMCENQSDVQNICEIPESHKLSFYAEYLLEKQMQEN